MPERLFKSYIPDEFRDWFKIKIFDPYPLSTHLIEAIQTRVALEEQYLVLQDNNTFEFIVGGLYKLVPISLYFNSRLDYMNLDHFGNFQSRNRLSFVTAYKHPKDKILTLLKKHPLIPENSNKKRAFIKSIETIDSGGQKNGNIKVFTNNFQLVSTFADLKDYHPDNSKKLLRNIQKAFNVLLEPNKY